MANRRPAGAALLRRIAWVGVAIAGVVILIVGLPVAALVLPYMWASLTACSGDERAVFDEFPHYGGVEREPEPFAESGGCAVFYDTQASQERVAAYYTKQLESHGWKVEQTVTEATLMEPQIKTAPEIDIMARREDFFYEILFESHELYDPPGPGAHVAVHLSKDE